MLQSLIITVLFSNQFRNYVWYDGIITLLVVFVFRYLCGSLAHVPCVSPHLDNKETDICNRARKRAPGKTLASQEKI